MRSRDLLAPGMLSKYEDGSIWRVESVTKGCADVRCLVAGSLKANRVGATSTISTSIAGHHIVDDATLETAKAIVDVGKKQCDACWTKHDPDVPCPTDCWCHDPTYAPRVRKAKPTAEEIARVLALRAAGMGYGAIEREMGWPDTHGNRPWKIVKDAENAK